MIEVKGKRYTVMHVSTRTYSIRTEPGGNLMGLFLLAEGENGPHVLGAEGSDVAAIVDVAERALAFGLIPM